MIVCILVVAAPVLFLCAQADTGENRYVDDFTKKQCWDVPNTTELWDTVTGVPQLPPVILTLAGSYNTAGNVREVTVSGYRAYVVSYSNGLYGAQGERRRVSSQ